MKAFATLAFFYALSAPAAEVCSIKKHSLTGYIAVDCTDKKILDIISAMDPRSLPPHSPYIPTELYIKVVKYLSEQNYDLKPSPYIGLFVKP